MGCCTWLDRRVALPRKILGGKILETGFVLFGYFRNRYWPDRFNDPFVRIFEGDPHQRDLEIPVKHGTEFFVFFGDILTEVNAQCKMPGLQPFQTFLNKRIKFLRNQPNDAEISKIYEILDRGECRMTPCFCEQ